ncbi:PP0621 family protein [Rhodoferax ferrireducens]|uniref:PP0621 family protein n=1 Tax=Rhodoferax ferrireducens TaxID=192843 RepID=UPI000E0D4B1F|nr:PP0621 family protein [Rhodoferax ferrireducens]
MKFLLILVVVLVGVWLWRTSRPSSPKPDRQQPQAAPQPLEMVSCAFCSVHIPSVDAIQGKQGVYCSAEHLHRAER